MNVVIVTETTFSTTKTHRHRTGAYNYILLTLIVSLGARSLRSEFHKMQVLLGLNLLMIIILILVIC